MADASPPAKVARTGDAQAPSLGVPRVRFVTDPAGVGAAVKDAVKFKGVLELKAPAAPPGFSAARDLLFVLDVSGSMSGEKLAKLVRVVDWAIESATPRDRVCLVSFNHASQRLTFFVDCTDSGKAELKAALAGLKADGGTDIRAALRQAKDALQERALRKAVTQVVLVSDGQDHEAKAALGANALDVAALGAPLYAVGLGHDHDADLLHDLAKAGSGTFCYAETADDVPVVVGTQVGGVASAVAAALTCVARMVGADKVETGPVLCEVNNIPFLLAEQTLYFPFEAEVPPEVASLRATLEFKEVERGATNTVHTEFFFKEFDPQEVGKDAVKPAAHADAVLIDSHFNRVAAAEAMKRATELSKTGDWTQALEALDDAKKSINDSVSANEALCQSLVQSLDELTAKMTEQRDQPNLGGFGGHGALGFALAAMQSHSLQRNTGLESAASAAYATNAERLASVAASQHF